MKVEVGARYMFTKDHHDMAKGAVWKVVEIHTNGELVKVETSYGVRFNRHIEYLLGLPLEEIPGEQSTKPTHYDTSIDTIAFLRANCPPEQVEGFLRGNALKYLQRYDKKNGVEDLRKAKHYVEMLIEEVEGRA